MKTLALFLAALVIGAGPAARADHETLFAAGTPSRLVLDGSSNVKDWRCSGTTLDSELTIAAPIEKINAVMDRIEDGNVGIWMHDPAEGRFPQPVFHLRVPVNTLRCGNPVMERDMNRALKGGRYPTIEFRFTGLLKGIEHDIDTNVYRARIRGELGLAGARRTVELLIVAQRIASNRFRIRAELPLKMTDFGIDPPTALLGMVRAKNDLTVRFDVTFEVQS